VQEIAIRPQAFEALGMQENGMTIAEIAEKLRKSERTVSNYLKTAKGQKVAIHSNGHTAEVAS
jgi:DNA-binding NarL/FixJ family response regulator